MQVTGLSLETAMAQYDLKHSELFWEKALDTKLLLAWNSRTIMLAFRGTASLANALADLQARPCTWPAHACTAPLPVLLLRRAMHVHNRTCYRKGQACICVASRPGAQCTPQSRAATGNSPWCTWAS